MANKLTWKQVRALRSFLLAEKRNARRAGGVDEPGIEPFAQGERPRVFWTKERGFLKVGGMTRSERRFLVAGLACSHGRNN